jgi:hypothetical protein
MADEMNFNTVDEIIKAYKNGFQGSFKDQDHYDKLMASLKHPYFGSAAPFLAGDGKGKLSMPFRSVLKFDPESYKERQTTGDCVSHGTRNACDISRAVEIDLRKEPEAWIARGATEVIYGMRGHRGQGMSCSRAAQIVNSVAGIVLRQKYDEVDLSTYNANWGIKWAPNNVPQSLMNVTKKHLIQTVSVIRTVEEARDAIANGYGLAVCSGQGFTSTRDANGFAYPRGSWAHCMCIAGCDDTGSEPAFLVINSWGETWIKGPMPQWGPIPKGSFMAKADVIGRMLRGGGTFAYSNFDGFPPQRLPNYGTADYLFG